LRSLIALVFAACLIAAPADSPLLIEMDKIAQAQLKQRAAVIAAISDAPAAQKRQAEVRTKILSLIGGLPNYRGPLNAKVTKTIDREGYVIENVLFESLPQYYVTANLYRPKRGGKHPAVLMSMGHWDGGKPAAQLLCANLARKGFVVLAYDPVGQGERQQAYDSRIGRSIIGGSTEQHFTNGAQAILLGQSVARYFIHDGMRAIDYLLSRPEVDAERIGATGCSGGGTQTTYIAALDPRVKVAAPACYMNSFQTLYSGSVGDSEQSVPGFLAAGLDQTDYVELFAPKPWLIASTEGDFFTPPGAKQVFEEAQRWYKQAGVEERIKWVVGPGGHGTPLMVREAIYEWMIRWLQKGDGNAREEQVELVPDRELLVTERGQVPGRELYSIINETPRTRAQAGELKQFIDGLLAANTPLVTNMKMLPETPGSSRKPAVILVQSTLSPGADAKALLEGGNVVVLVAPSGASGDNMRPRSGNWLNNTRAWLIGRNLPAMHAAEINAAAAMVARRSDVDPKHIGARATGPQGVWLLLAAAANPQISDVTLDRAPHSLQAALQAPVHTHLHDAVIPGFALKWDFADLRQLIAPRKVTWVNPTDWMGNVVEVSGDYTYRSSDPNASYN
jgi:dienelactone hydrolase